MNGASERSRTVDLLITNELLYQLSYTGVRGNVAMGLKAGKEIGLNRQDAKFLFFLGGFAPWRFKKIYTDVFRSDCPSNQPAQVQRRQIATEATMLAPAFGQSFCWMSSRVCKLKVEKVVKPPQKPVIKKSAVGDLRWSIPQNPAAMPMASEPSTLAARVPKGKVSNRARPTASPCRPRLPSAPPRAMQSQVMRGMYTRARWLARGFLSFYLGGVKGWRMMTRMVRVEIQLVVLLGSRQTHWPVGSIQRPSAGFHTALAGRWLLLSHTKGSTK